MLAGSLVIALWAFAAQGQVSVVLSDDLAAARALYATGDYETALTRLAAARSVSTADEVDQYRALCLLALGRMDETEQSLQELVTRRPHFRMSEDEVSPRLIGMFRSVRQRMLPGIIKDLYARGRARFDEKRHAEAASELRDMLELLEDADSADAPEAVRDLRILGEGFLKLAAMEVAAARAAAEAATREAAARDAAAREALVETVAAPPALYSDSDVESGVVPPVVISRTLPAWRPTSTAMAARSAQGHLRLIIDEQGRVESASLIRPFLPGYDALLVEAARQWQFRPAVKNGVTVRYVRIFTIDVSAR